MASEKSEAIFKKSDKIKTGLIQFTIFGGLF